MQGIIKIKLSRALKIWLVVSCLLPMLAKADDKTAMEWIQAMSDAMRHLNYRGHFVYLHDHQLESMLISHIKTEQGEKEQLLSLNGEAREIIRDDKNLICIWPNSRKVMVDFSRRHTYSPLLVPQNVEKISQLYDLELSGTDRIGGQQTVVVQIKPKDQYRYGLKLWINVENALLMKSHLINEHDKIVEQVMFTNLELLSSADQVEFSDLSNIDENYTLIRHSDSHSKQTAQQTAWRMNTMLAGFSQKSILKRLDPASKQFIHQMVYTDGLATLSIFIEKQASQLKHGKSSMGAVNAFIRIMGDYSVTAIGEVPAVTVQSMAESVFYQQP